MSIKRYGFRLGDEQLHYLRRAFSGREGFADFLSQNEPGAGSHIVLLTRDEAEQLRQALTEELARIGFDESYALTPQGCVIEELIDKFFLPND